MTAGTAWIGTSGWNYRHWIGPFYPEGTKPKDFLEEYLKHFRTTELNTTFYRLPPAAKGAAGGTLPEELRRGGPPRLGGNDLRLDR